MVAPHDVTRKPPINHFLQPKLDDTFHYDELLDSPGVNMGYNPLEGVS